MLLTETQCRDGQWPTIMHRKGPAFISAGPGSGKTTTLVNRLVRMAQEGYDISRVLLMAYNRTAVMEIKERVATALTEIGKNDISQPDIKTYHGLGYHIARRYVQTKKDEPVLTNPESLMKAILSPSMGPLTKGGPRRPGFGWNDERDVRMESSTAITMMTSLHQQMILPSQVRKYFSESLGDAGEVMIRRHVWFPVDMGSKIPQNVEKQEIRSKTGTLLGYDCFMDCTLVDAWTKLYSFYHNEKKQRGVLTFDDMLFATWLILTKQIAELRKLFTLSDEKAIPGALSYWQRQWDFVMTDEVQDLDPLQGTVIMELLAAKHKNILAVGDVNQAVYRFRGASPEFVPGLMRRLFPEHQVYHLSVTQRCPRKIIDLANTIISYNPHDEQYKPIESAVTLDGDTGLVSFADENEQVDYIAHEIITDRESHADRPLKYYGCISRTRATLGILEESLFRNGIDYRVLGGGNMWCRREVKQTVAFIACVAGTATLEQIQECQNICSVSERGTTRYLGEAACDWEANQFRYLKRQAQHKGKSDMQLLEVLAYSDYEKESPVIKKFRRALRNFCQLIEWMSQSAQPEEASETPTTSDILKAVREMAMDEYVKDGVKDEDIDGESKLDILDALGSLASRHRDPHQFIQVIKDLQDKANDTSDERDCVQIGTAHGWKGLEREYIFILSITNGIFPHKKCTGYAESMQPGYDAIGICDERNLLYVAISRAKERLMLCTTTGASLFLEEMHLLDVEPEQVDIRNLYREDEQEYFEHERAGVA